MKRILWLVVALILALASESAVAKDGNLPADGQGRQLRSHN